MKRFIVVAISLVAIASVWYFAHPDERNAEVKQHSAVESAVSKAERSKAEMKSPQKSVTTRVGENGRSIWQEYASAISASQFYSKYGTAPVGSTERFLADYAVLSCGALTTVGPDRFTEFTARRRKTLPIDANEDAAQDLTIRQYTASCRDFLSVLTAERVKSGMNELQSRGNAESRALAILGRIHVPNTAAKNLKDAEQILDSTNPFVVQAMSQVWAQAARERVETMDTSIFRGMSPDAVQAAWTLAACDLGIDCGAKNELVFLECITERRCLAENVFGYYERYVLSRTQLAQTDLARTEILQALKNRNYSRLGIK